MGDCRGAVIFVVLSFFSFTLKSQIFTGQQPERWADSVLSTMTLDQKIAQCIMPAVYPRDSVQVAEIMRQIKRYNPGGIIIFQGGPKQVALLVNTMQSAASIPMLVGVDGEWGVAMRFDSVLPFPRQLTLGAMDNDSLIYQMGVAIAAQLKRLGIHTNFAPVVDINSNPLNPVIGSRSWGSDRDRVTHQASVYMKALQDNGILAVAKHFPGHGDTENDSHYALPVLNYSRQRLDTFELYPFKSLINEGVMGVMTAHLNVPAFDSAKIPASLSRRITDSLLRQQLNFKGIIFTDALNMKGAQNGSPKAIAVKAFQAGNDILLMPVSLPDAIDTLTKAVKAGIIDESEVQRRCKRILSVKYALGIHRFHPVDTTNLLADLNSPLYQLLRRKLYESAITLIENNNDLVPLKRLDTLRIAIVAIGDTMPGKSFRNTADLYTSCDYFALHRNASDSDYYRVYRQLHGYNLIITLLLNTDMRLTRRYGVTDQQINFIELIAFNYPTVLCVFGSPYILNYFPTLRPYQSVLIAYEDNPLVYDIAAQAVFGGIPIQGRLPVSGVAKYAYRHGITVPSPIRVKYTLPEEVGINSIDFNRVVDSVIYSAIRQKAMPGCVVYMAKDNKVFFHKAYGYFTYDSLRPVCTHDLYDLASVTKIAATTPAIMKLYEAGEIKLDAPIVRYIPSLRKSNKKKLALIDILTHQACLQPVIDIYPNVLVSDNRQPTKKNGKQNPVRYLGWKQGIFADTASETRPLQVAMNMYVSRAWQDTVLKLIAESPLLPRKEYVYSDLGFILLHRAVEGIIQRPMEVWIDSVFYRPLGANTLTFLPLQKFPTDRIAPTEIDTFFRKQTLQGTVHDPVAALMGGVAGHAGLFGSANDLGKYMHLLINKGTYGGIHYFDSTTINLFTSAPYLSTGNRRGLGFDKPQPDSTKASPVSRFCSPSSFGHTGFTGTMAWADPQYGFVFIFLSNRTYPHARTNKLAELNVRTTLQDIVYPYFIQHKH